MSPATRRLTHDELAAARLSLPGWQVHAGVELRRTFTFPDYDATIAFVNAVARIAVEQDHHPELLVGYGTCEVRWSTHSVGGISQRDFDCAGLVDEILAG